MTAPDPRLDAIKGGLHGKISTLAWPETPEERDEAEEEITADLAYLLSVVEAQAKALDDLMFIANHKAADTERGRWWAEVIRGPIIRHLGAEKAATMGALAPEGPEA